MGSPCEYDTYIIMTRKYQSNLHRIQLKLIILRAMITVYSVLYNPKGENDTDYWFFLCAPLALKINK